MQIKDIYVILKQQPFLFNQRSTFNMSFSMDESIISSDFSFSSYDCLFYHHVKLILLANCFSTAYGYLQMVSVHGTYYQPLPVVYCINFGNGLEAFVSLLPEWVCLRKLIMCV